MTSQHITLELPASLYERLRERASQAQRTIEAEVREAVATVLEEAAVLPDDMEADLAGLSLLTDSELWNAARTTFPQEATEQLAALNLKQRVGLTASEAESLAALLRLYDRVMLVRAQAAALLKQREYDISSLLSPV
jgi:plasmid stability protein